VADETLLLPKIDYYLDESEPDILVLRRQDDAFVAAFSAQGATKEGMLGHPRGHEGGLSSPGRSKQGHL